MQTENILLVNKKITLQDKWTDQDFVEYSKNIYKYSSGISGLFANPDINVKSASITFDIELEMADIEDNRLDEAFWVDVALEKTSG